MQMEGPAPSGPGFFRNRPGQSRALQSPEWFLSVPSSFCVDGSLSPRMGADGFALINRPRGASELYPPFWWTGQRLRPFQWFGLAFGLWLIPHPALRADHWE